MFKPKASQVPGLVVWLALAGISLFSSFYALSAETADTPNANPQKIFLINTDFPLDGFAHYPVRSVKATQFLNALDTAFARKNHFELTENMEEADYRVELQCGGVIYCTRLKVYIQSPNRDVLATYSLRGRFPISSPSVTRVADQLVQTLEQKIPAIEEGDVGNSR